MLATKFVKSTYTTVLKPILFLFDPEKIHDLFIIAGSILGRYRATRSLTSRFFKFTHASLQQKILGIDFANPVGLAAGFDKDAKLMNILPAVGFGFEEIGSITGEPCAGNPGKRLWRLPGSKSIRVFYGLKNPGCEVIATKLANRKFDFPIGVSVAKTNCAATADDTVGINDYAKAMETCLNIGEYFTINISCPNAYGGQPFTDPAKLDRLLARLDQIETNKPVFLKISADLNQEQLDEVVNVCDKHRVHGFVVANLTKNPENPCIAKDEIPEGSDGGFSGKPTFELSNKQIARIYQTCGDRYVIIGCGGTFSAEDAYEKIRQGASLVQLITGMIFEGPQLIGEINQGLVDLLKKDGYHNISEAVGAEHR